MKHTPLIFVFSLMIFIVGCQEKSSKKKSSSSNALCVGTGYYTVPGCPGYSGTTAGGYTGTTTGGTTGTTVGGTNGGTTGGYNNPYPNYSSFYADKNWQVKYPYAPSIECSTPVAPSGISYTPYETRKGTVTVVGAGFGPIPGTSPTQYRNPQDPKAWYDPNTYIALSSGDQTSERLRTLQGAKEFFWTDSALKIRFKANLQPDSSNGNPICHGRVSSQAWIKGYSKIKFNLHLVGTRADGTTNEEFLGEQTVEIQKCTPAINLANFNGINYPSKYPNGIYLKIKNVRGNQNWAPGGANYWESYYQQQAFDQWGFYSKTQSSMGYGNPYYDGNSYMQAIRANDCWSVDIEVAADGTKTF